MHQVIHDYDDDTCRHILKQIMPAMEAGYSKILINELIVPDQGAHWLTTAIDWELLQSIASLERTETEFRNLIDSVGLRIAGIYKHPQGYDSIIEVVLP